MVGYIKQRYYLTSTNYAMNTNKCLVSAVLPTSSNPAFAPLYFFLVIVVVVVVVVVVVTE